MCLLECLTIYLASTLPFQQLILLSKSHPRSIDRSLRSVREAKNVNSKPYILTERLPIEHDSQQPVQLLRPIVVFPVSKKKLFVGETY
jgi:hypothetical protein